MPDHTPDDENIPRYTRGFEWFTHLVRTDMRGRPWRKLGLFSYYDAPYVESERLYLSPKQAMLAMAADVKSQGRNVVMVVDAMEKAEMGLSTKQGFDQFMELYDGIFPDAAKFYFGSRDSDRTWLHDYPSLKIPLQWVIQHPVVFAEVLSDASPVGEIVGPADASFEDFAGMTEVLVEKLGPPSLSEEVLGKIRSTEASEYAGEAVGLLTVFISPATAVTRSVRYLGKFVSLLKNRRKQEVKEVYEEWAQRVRDGYSEENLRKYFDDDPSFESELTKAVEEVRPVLLVLETRGTLYDLFMPLITQQLVEVVGYVRPEDRPKEAVVSSSRKRSSSSDSGWDSEELAYEEIDTPDGESEESIAGAVAPDVELSTDVEMSSQEFEGKPETVLFLDAATHLSKFNRSFKFSLKIPERHPNMSVAASFFTQREKISQALRDAVVEYMSDRALVFDLHPDLFDAVTANIPISTKAWLMGQLQEMERIHAAGGVAFLEYYAPQKNKWTLRSVDKPDPKVIREIRGWFRKKTD
ncbi:MAG: hypothetical protein HXY34_05060 [Candidatus Thorarchaeota archaeon]|nr:hypothetical protein [Candidatus Thorarchaeota archaeon]